ncbi:2Fe-2S iron-sulfur cluster-binding protein [Phaeobacter sp. B1627]|uniref:2Fe-2S iron-sulfur cluster-binding protein n=1 Tax=Phaeobacter sp. B1627 TaxID=2583809 RepID=UPI00111A23B6|nr:2Fe-2S iron-sulfur cluster-binding protein [Phaeobacter sp. B1627]TNJ47700.1 2Fe-2S iron-sulfur cluster binding domain-containing protein [Phaeobacter sp. B1627]
MARFHALEVTDIRKTIRDAVVVTLRPANDAAPEFDFVQGQYLTFRRQFDGCELRRSYSICAGRDEGLLQVGIKRVDGGTFSTWANSDLRVGDRIDAMPPQGRFHTRLDAEAQRHYLGFAGGSGITPVLSILKTTLAFEPRSRFTLAYANRSVNSIMFRQEIEDLKNRYMDRLSVVHILETDTQEVDLFTGRITQDKCTELFARWIPVKTVDRLFVCGPEPMMRGIVAAAKTAGLEDDQIKYELFASDQPGRAHHRAAAPTHASTAPVTAAITLDGATRTVTFDRNTTLLEAALANDLDAPFACQAGVCSTCRCRVIEGEVEMAANHALEDDEVAKGYVLSCQSVPLTDRLVVDYDQ